MTKDERVNEIEVAATLEGVQKISEEIDSDLTRAKHNLNALVMNVSEALGKLLKGVE